MLKVQDNRTRNEYKVKDLEPNAFFIYKDVLCRRVSWRQGDMDIRTEWDEEIVMYEIPSGVLGVIDRDAYVEFIPDSQIELVIEE